MAYTKGATAWCRNKKYSIKPDVYSNNAFRLFAPVEPWRIVGVALRAAACTFQALVADIAIGVDTISRGMVNLNAVRRAVIGGDVVRLGQLH